MQQVQHLTLMNVNVNVLKELDMMPTKNIQCSWRASSFNIETIPGSFKKQAMSDIVPLWLLFKRLPGFRSQTSS